MPIWKKVIRYVSATLLIIAGIISLFLPFAPGILLILVGLYLLNLKWLHRQIDILKKKYELYKSRKRKK